jgi:hypothetical protein
MIEKKDINLIFKKDFEIFFSDYVKLEANLETVSFTFAVRSPDNLSAEVSHRVIMTLPHFFRLCEICGKADADMKQRIENLKKEIK